MLRINKELEGISAALERVFGGEKIEPAIALKDSLSGKIYHQIERISDTFTYREEALTRERDEIKELVSDIAHELRTPLTNIETYVQLLKDTDLTREQQKYLQAIMEAEQNIQFLTESFIKMARFEIQLIQIKKDSCDIESTILKSILQVKKKAEAKNITIALKIQKNDILHDKNWLGEVIVNLLDNSIKYSDSDAAIQIKAIENNMFSEIIVEDWGRGILPGEENLIFKRFYRGKNTKDTRGYGIGLYLSNKIIHLHDGFMKVKRKSRGMEMSIFLPNNKT